MEVTIYRCSNKFYWYQKHIGETFEVEDSYNDINRYMVKSDNKTVIRTIDLEDTLEDLDYNDYKETKNAEEAKSIEIYKEVREFLQKHKASPSLKKKLFILYENASFFD